MTFESHVEARLATANGYGFYTIGPCGEELLGTIGNILEPSDAVALHYRHVAISIQRQLQIGTTIENIALDRARAYTCSIKDQVTSGRHCALGGTKNDFYVTSTLATQTPPAVGRALDTYVGTIFKPLVLLRPAWTVRVIAEEQLRAVANGALGVLDHPIGLLARIFDDSIGVRGSYAKEGWLDTTMFKLGISESATGRISKSVLKDGKGFSLFKTTSSASFLICSFGTTGFSSVLLLTNSSWSVVETSG